MSATNRGAIRNASDFYPTPSTAFLPLLPYLDKQKLYWEPACGDGRLIRQMQQAGISANGRDLNDGYDFLLSDTQFDGIVTNPPFSLALEFCNKAISCSAETFMLLRLNFLGAQKRRSWWQAHEPSALFVLSERPCFTNDGKTDATDYAWFYWGERHKGIFHL